MTIAERKQWREEAQRTYDSLSGFRQWLLSSGWGGPIRLPDDRWLFWCAECQAPDIDYKHGFDSIYHQGSRLDCFGCGQADIILNSLRAGQAAAKEAAKGRFTLHPKLAARKQGG